MQYVLSGFTMIDFSILNVVFLCKCMSAEPRAEVAKWMK